MRCSRTAAACATAQRAPHPLGDVPRERSAQERAEQQGDHDEHVPLHQSRRLYEALQVTKRMEVLPGADHQFTKGEDFTRMTNMIADWLTTHLT